jgi:arylsulfatase
VRVADWKLVAKHGGPWELYDISKDRIEAQDLAPLLSDKVKELAAKYEAWAKRAKVEPWPVAAKKK